jgi:RNA-directed DNA polymerase
MGETQTSPTVSTKLERIAKLARQAPTMSFRTLAHHIDEEWLLEAYRRTRKDGAAGVDGQTGKEYEQNLQGNLRALLERVKAGQYRAPAVRRVHIPKGDGQTRPLGIPTFEDKVLQRAVAMVLEAVYEQDFLDCSHGFRPRRSAHGALTALRDAMMEMGGGWVYEVDIKKFFDTIDHERLKEAIRQRVCDGALLRLIGKWLNAGVNEAGVLSRPSEGTPQGGVISPLLANIFLHVVLDTWFEQEVRPRMRGRTVLVRYADDFVIVFEQEADARKVTDVLPKRFEKYGLTIHPDKSRLVQFKRPTSTPPKGDRRGDCETFDLLGFTHFWARSRNAFWVVMLKTATSRLSRALQRVNEWCRRNRHRPVREQWSTLVQKLRGHYQYFGIAGNWSRLYAFRRGMYGAWRKWLNRRSQRARMTWHQMRLLSERYDLPVPPTQLRNLRT